MDRSAEQLYDEYVEAAMAGHAMPPEEFLSSSGVRDAELLDTLKAVYEQAQGRAMEEPHPAVNGDGMAGRARHLGEFRLIRKLGEGGMGVVFLAEQGSLGRTVALKVIRGEAAMSQAAGSRFEREARSVAKLHHPNIVTVHAVGESGGVRYIAMEMVEGRGLDEILAEAAAGEGLPAARVIRWGAALARALHCAHEHGVVHRDVKPSNIRITPADQPMLLDFGLARELGSRAATYTEAFVGSPYYAAPEQVGRGGGQVDARTDVYSLGAVLYEALTGSPPTMGETLEQVLHSIVADDPAPPRAKNPRVSRDLSVVVMKALEKDPGKRYASAEAMAVDLEAILELRPIAARPPGPLERTVRWASRNRAAAAAGATAVLAIVAAGTTLVIHRVTAATARAKEISETLGRAEELLAQTRDQFRTMRDLESRFEELNRTRGGEHFTEAKDREIDSTEDMVLRLRRKRDVDTLTVLELLSRAERLGAEPGKVHAVRAGLYVQRYMEALVSKDEASLKLYRALVAENDPDGSYMEQLRGNTVVRVECPTPGARVHMFRRVLASDEAEGAEPRRVLLPLHGAELPAVPDTWALRVSHGAESVPTDAVILSVAGRPIRGTMLVSRGAGAVKELDRLAAIDGTPVPGEWEAEHYGGGEPLPGQAAGRKKFEFERAGEKVVVEGDSLEALGIEVATPGRIAERGGAPAKVWVEGEVRDITLPTGLAVRTTAAPEWLGPASLLGPAPVVSPEVEAGQYVVVIRAPGYETFRRVFTVGRGSEAVVSVELTPLGTSPPGFVRVPMVGVARPEAWMMEHEVTIGEYLEFLNDPAVKAEIAASPTPIRYPFDNETARGQKDAAGNFAIPDGWKPDWPVLFVTWFDAKAYAAWRTAKAKAAGQPWEFALPTQGEFVNAMGQAETDIYHFGPRFRPKWVCSCFAHPKPDPEPVMRYPIDSTVYGVFDAAGSAAEWLEDIWVPGEQYRTYACGAWGSGDSRMFTAYGGNGMLPDRRMGMVGFRLIAIPTRTLGEKGTER